MQSYKIVIDLEKNCRRTEDVINSSAYPTKVWDAKGILVKEDKSILPWYQPMPPPEVNILHAAGYIPDQTYEEQLSKLGVFDSPEVMFTLRKIVNGLNCKWGRNLYFSTLLISDDLNSADPHAGFVDSKEWDYLFKPGEFNFGSTGRILVNKDGTKFQEQLSMKITSDLVYDAIMNGGIHLERVGILTDEGKIEVVYNNGYIEDKYPNSVSLKGRFSESQFKKINLSDIVESGGMTVEEHPFHKKTEKWEGIYIFETSDKTLRELVENSAFTTNNVIWRFSLLELHDNDPNSFLRQTIGFDKSHYVMYATHASSFSFGTTGRSIKIADRFMENGYPAPSNWQSECIGLEIDRNMLISALFGLGDNLKRLIMSDSSNPEAPWIAVHNPSECIMFENQRILPREESRRHL